MLFVWLNVGRGGGFSSVELCCWLLFVSITFWKSGNGDSNFSLQSVVYFFFFSIAFFWELWGIWGATTRQTERERNKFSFLFLLNFHRLFCYPFQGMTSFLFCCPFLFFLHNIISSFILFLLLLLYISNYFM